MQLITLLPVCALLSGALAQINYAAATDANGIEFWNAELSTDVGTGDAQFGLALPPVDADDLTDEYIGRLVVPIPESGTWFGITHKSGMTGNLILMAWPSGDEVITDFRYASGYTSPASYTGNATLSQISSSVNESYFELTYRCQNCWVWDHEGSAGSNIPGTEETSRQIMGWAQAAKAPSTPDDKHSAITQHASANMFYMVASSARNKAYTEWTALAKPSETEAPYPSGTNGTAPAGPTAVPSGVACPTNNLNANQTYDYIIVGSGAGGIPTAAKLAESGKKVLLIERGPASSGRHGGTMKPDWLVGTNLTRFDVPGLDNEIWVNSDGIACSDYSVMAGCVLGGGTAVNAGLWWNPDPLDFDEGFPEGWKHADIEPAISRVFKKIPFNERPSKDGELYKAQGYKIVGGALAAAGWKNVSAGLEPAEKNRSFTHPNHMFSNGERGGPMATYLVDAKELPNFTLMVNTTVNRVIRDGNTATGVNVQAFLPGGQCGDIKLATGGRVVLSAGAFGSPKILLRSGIGPQDQLEIVKKAEADKMVDEADWINLPVGENLDDHANTEIVITHPNVEFYDFYEAYDNPIKSDAEKYLDSRSGILAQSAPNLGVVFWHHQVGPDGITRSNQWTARIESGHGVKSNKSISLSHYLGRGKTSRGRTTITSGLNMIVSQTPYLNNENDLAATKGSIETVIAALTADKQVEVVFPAKNTTIDQHLENYAQTTGGRSGNHWMGSCKMGTDSGLENGTAVVDTNTKVYGMENLFVVDASIFPEMITTNPSALIVSVAEHASEKILALESTSSAGNTTVVPEVAPVASNTTVSAKPSVPLSTGLATLEPSAPASNNTEVATPTATSVAEPLSSAAEATSAAQATSSAASSAAAPAASSTSGSTAALQEWATCGGSSDYKGSTTCAEGLTCKKWNDYYSQCIKA